MRRTIVKVFLASPGDLVEERRAAKRIVDEENRNHAIPQGFQFELVGWEDTVAQHGRAQEVINRDLDQCNFFIGILWKRWGSPPGPNDFRYSSGFEEEYERSAARYKSTGKPSISLLFKSISAAEVTDAGPQLQKVLEFKRAYTENYKGVYHTFEDLRAFEERFRAILAHFFRIETAQESKVEAEELSKPLETGNETEEQKSDKEEKLFDKGVRDFISDLFSRDSELMKIEFTAAEVARLRLLGSSLKRSENDDIVIGVHDANIIYKEIRTEAISKREIRALLSAGLNYFDSQNAPLWSWLWRFNDAPFRDAMFATMIGSDTQRKNAFKVLALFPRDPIEADGIVSREQLLDWWLDQEEGDLVVSALAYIGRCGALGDLEKIESLLDSSEVTVSKAAVTAKIGILARNSAEAALEFISTRDDAEVSEAASSIILGKPETIRTELLRSCLSNRSTFFRRQVARELRARNELSRDDAETLSQSHDAETRMIACDAIILGSASFSLSDARKIIIKPKGSLGAGIFSVGGLDFEGEANFEIWKHDVLCNYKESDLESLLEREHIYSHDITFALYDKFFLKYKAQLIDNLSDGFETFLQRKIARSDPSVVPDSKLADFVRQNLVQRSVELLATKSAPQSLTLIRKAIDLGGIRYADSILHFLKGKGGCEDAPRIIRICENFPSVGSSLLSNFSRNREYKTSAVALLKLCRGKIADLLSIHMPVELWSAIIEEMSRVTFASFDDNSIISWLRDESDKKRSTTALKCVICLSKTRNLKLLDSYISGGGTYYYNSVFWLDLSASADHTSAVRIAKNALYDC